MEKSAAFLCSAGGAVHSGGDRRGDKFRHGDDYWVGDVGPSPTAPSPIWDKFMQFPYDFPNSLDYVVGANRWNTDWNYVQSVYPDSSGGTVVVASDNALAGATSALGSLPVTFTAGGWLTNAPTADSGAGSSYHLHGLLTLTGGTLGGGGNNAGNGIK